MKRAMPPILARLSSIIEHYRAVILDLWGVLHDGHAPYPGAVHTLKKLRAAGVATCLLSNSPRRATEVANRLATIGISPDLYDHLVTSGELAFEAFCQRTDPWHAALGQRYLHLGPPELASLLAGLDYGEAAIPAEADFILCTGTNGDQTVADFLPALFACAAHTLPMICVNPDLVVPIAERMVICAGTLAECYEHLGGRVHYHGKPHAAAYRYAFQLLSCQPTETLAIGDSLRTDVAGANQAGVDVILVTGGVHRNELQNSWGEEPDQKLLSVLLSATSAHPTAVISRLCW